MTFLSIAMERILRRKLPDLPANWDVGKAERIGTDSYHIWGCETRIFKSGAKKGKTIYRLKSQVHDVVMTDAEIKEEEVAYIKETGNCPRCEGKKTVTWRVWTDGIEYKSCPDCKGTGKGKLTV